MLSKRMRDATIEAKGCPFWLNIGYCMIYPLWHNRWVYKSMGPKEGEFALLAVGDEARQGTDEKVYDEEGISCRSAREQRRRLKVKVDH